MNCVFARGRLAKDEVASPPAKFSSCMKRRTASLSLSRCQRTQRRFMWITSLHFSGAIALRIVQML